MMVLNPGRGTGTALLCKCCEGMRHSMGRVFPERGLIVVADRKHGTLHVAAWTLPQLVALLDPKGTAYRSVIST